LLTARRTIKLRVKDSLLGAGNNARLAASKYTTATCMGRPVAECQTILDVVAARDDGRGDGDSWNSNACKVPFKSPPSTYCH